jgi:hypothetical protein
MTRSAATLVQSICIVGCDGSGKVNRTSGLLVDRLIHKDMTSTDAQVVTQYSGGAKYRRGEIGARRREGGAHGRLLATLGTCRGQLPQLAGGQSWNLVEIQCCLLSVDNGVHHAGLDVFQVGCVVTVSLGPRVDLDACTTEMVRDNIFLYRDKSAAIRLQLCRVL